MPLYYFHIDGLKPHVDTTGEELPDDDRAWASALRMLQDLESGFAPGDEWTLKIYRGKPISLRSRSPRFSLADEPLQAATRLQYISAHPCPRAFPMVHSRDGPVAALIPRRIGHRLGLSRLGRVLGLRAASWISRFWSTVLTREQLVGCS